jgi:hypothetical protein
LDEWIYFLKHDRIKDGFSAKGLEKARDLLAYDKLSPNEKKAYEDIQMEKSHRISQIASAQDVVRIKAEKEFKAKEKEFKEAIQAKNKAIQAKNKKHKEAIQAKDKKHKEELQAKDEEIAALKRLFNQENQEKK